MRLPSAPVPGPRRPFECKIEFLIFCARHVASGCMDPAGWDWNQERRPLQPQAKRPFQDGCDEPLHSIPFRRYFGKYLLAISIHLHQLALRLRTFDG